MPESKEDRSLGELLSELSRETGQLVRKEVELATTEMTAKAQQGRRGGGRGGGRRRACFMPGCSCSLPRSSSASPSLASSPWLSALIVAIVTMMSAMRSSTKGWPSCGAPAWRRHRPSNQ